MKKLLYFIVLISVILQAGFFSGMSVSASDSFYQDGILRDYHPQTGKLSFLGADPINPVHVDKAMERGLVPESRAVANLEMYAREFGIRDTASELRVMRSANGDDRLTVKYQQVYNDIPVMAGELIVNMKGNGGLLSINGEVSPDMKLDTQPKLSADEARLRALAIVSQTYDLAKAELTVSEPELWIFDERLIQDNATQPVHLVWRMEVASENAPLRELVLVNAQSGKISLHFNQVDTSWTGNQPPVKEAAVNPEAVPAAEPIHAPATGLVMPLAGPDPSLNLFVAPGGTDEPNNCQDYTNPCATINYAISQAQHGQKLGVAVGTYTGSGFHVVNLDKGVHLSGGWDALFFTQTGYSVIDGENARRGVYISAIQLERSIDRFIIQNGNATYNDVSDPGDGNVGGIFMGPFTTVTITNSIIRNNAAPRAYHTGGGIHSYGYILNMVNSAVVNNQAYMAGGIYIQNTQVNLENTTIGDNSAKQSAGGLYIEGVVTVLNSTISNNHAPVANAFSGGLTIENSIVAGDGPYACSAVGVLNTGVHSNGHNLFDGNCNMKYHATDIVSPYMGLGTLLTKGYQPLVADSPAINNGNPSTCLPTDARGLSRVACDIGAYEYSIPGNPTALWLNSGDNQKEGLGQTFPLPLSVVVLDGQGTPVPGATVTFTAPASDASIVFDESGTNEVSRISDSAGTATTPKFTANTNFGSYTVTATEPAIAEPAVFHLKNFFWVVVPAASGGNDANDCLSPATPCATIEGVISKPGFKAGDKIGVSVGVFDNAAITLAKNVILLGGWNTSFTERIGATILKDPITIASTANVQIRYFSITGTGGTAITNHGTLLVGQVSIYSNKEGVYNDGELTVVNSTIYSNSNTVKSPARAGGITDQGKAWLINTTITGNRGAIGGLLSSYETYLANTIIVGNTSILSNQQRADCGTGNVYSIISLDYNLIGRTSYSCEADWGGHDLLGTSASPIAVSRVLGGRLNAGNGVTVYPLKLGSLALDAGNTAPSGSGGNSCPATDQIGAARPQGGACDIGATEYQFDSQPTDFLLATYTARHAKTVPGALACSGSDAICTSGDSHVQSAHKYAFDTYNRYNLWHARNSIDGQGLQINSTVRYGAGYQNAFWNGYMMVYGDGYGFPLADDVVAHELTHGVTQFESNLFYWYQSGAINESFSDLWGEAVDQLNGMGTDTADVKWKIGEDVTGLGAIRNMSNPTLFRHPDSMTSQFYCKSGACLDDNGGVHTNSGVNNKAVYLMVNGGTFNGRTVRRLGWMKVLAIYYEAQTNLLTSGSDYLDLYNSLYQACKNKVGTRGIVLADCAEVRDATVAVGMSKSPAANFNPDAAYCPAKTFRVTPDLYFENFESGTDGWSFDVPVGALAWGLSGENATSGRYSLWANDSYEKTDSQAMTGWVYLPPGSKPYLHFSHFFRFDTSGTTYYDGGILEYWTSTNGWRDAKPLFSAGLNYGGTIAYGSNALGGYSAFVGDSHGFVDSRYTLASLAGKMVRFRWRLGTDSYGFQSGWYVDDIRIYLCVATPSVPSLLAPTNGATLSNLLPVFDWSNSTPDLHHYQLQLATNDTFTANLQTYNAIPVSAFSLTTELISSTTYYWRVRAFNAAGKASAWSTVWSFTTP